MYFERYRLRYERKGKLNTTHHKGSNEICTKDQYMYRCTRRKHDKEHRILPKYIFSLTSLGICHTILWESNFPPENQFDF